jgi:hypothetical protein
VRQQPHNGSPNNLKKIPGGLLFYGLGWPLAIASERRTIGETQTTVKENNKPEFTFSPFRQKSNLSTQKKHTHLNPVS